MAFRVGWYFISIIRADGSAIRIEGLDIDAIFATSEQDARQTAAERNPLKPNQQFKFTRASTFRAKQKALDLHEQRNQQVEQLKEIADKS